MIVSFSQAPVASTLEDPLYLTTEEGTLIGIGPPTLKAPSTKSFKIFNTDNISINYKQTKSINSVTETISFIPSLYVSTIEIPFEFKNGEYIELYQDELGKTYNTENIYNKEHNSIGVISTKVVKNAENVNITSKIKENNIVVLYVDSHNLSEAISIEVEITASTYSTYFSEGIWISRGGMESLSLTTNPYLR